MFQELTIFILGLVTGLFGLVAVLYLFVFERSRIRLVLGVILAVYALYLLKDLLYLLKDLLYLQEGVADNPFIYKLLLSIDTWAVPLYVMFAFEFLYPGKMTLRKDDTSEGSSAVRFLSSFYVALCAVSL